MDKPHISTLIEKYIEGTASTAECQELLDWYRSVDHTEIHWPENEMQFEARIDRIKANILNQNQAKQKPERKSLLRRKSLLISLISTAAAAILVLLFLPGVFRNQKTTDNLLVDAATTIVPGGNKATLTLSDGSVVALSDSTSSYNSAHANGLDLYTHQGELTLRTDSRPSASTKLMNTLRTPRGGQYVVNLPDGSKVWLNAESSLSFPCTFDTKERKVALQGEAYFDIAENKDSPFLVNVDEVQIKVLGTEFNINAYPDLPHISTSLVEGAVSLTQGAQHSVLRPNQQGNWNKARKEFQVRDIDTRAITAWKNGFFAFENTNIKTIMSQLARWYDIEVVYLGDTANKEYTGNILKRSNIQEVLDMLELTGTIGFEIKGRRISVMP